MAEPPYNVLPSVVLQSTCLQHLGAHYLRIHFHHQETAWTQDPSCRWVGLGLSSGKLMSSPPGGWTELITGAFDLGLTHFG